jgi:hypothetical protein
MPVAHDWIDADEHGVLLLSPKRGSENILRLHPTGDLVLWATVAGNYRTRIIKGGDIVAVDSAGQLAYISQTGARRRLVRTDRQPTGASGFYRCFSGNDFISIESTTGFMSRDIGTDTLATFKPAASQIQQWKVVFNGSSTKDLIGSMHCGQDGSVHLFLISYMLAAGAPLLRIDVNGQVQKQFILMLPTHPTYKTSGNPDGFVLPYTMTASGSRVYLLSSQGDILGYDVQ